jgi:hypothetical protein
MGSHSKDLLYGTTPPESLSENVAEGSVASDVSKIPGIGGEHIGEGKKPENLAGKRLIPDEDPAEVFDEFGNAIIGEGDDGASPVI